MAFIADLLLSRRIAQSAGRRKVRHLRHHVIVVGLGSFGIRVVSDLTAAGLRRRSRSSATTTTAILSAAARLDVPVIFGDATLRQTLESARIDDARAVAVLTQDDMVNIETGIVLQRMLGPRARRRPIGRGPIVLRVYDRTLGAAVAQRFGFENVRSTVDLATPWFIGAAMGLHVLRHVFGGTALVHGGRRARRSGSELDGLRMADLSTQTRVIAITRPDTPVRLHPRRDTTL